MDAAVANLAATNSTGGGGYLSLVFIVLMVGVFYFLLIRPQQRRARSQRELVQSLDIGDEVITIGGMYGTIRSQDDESVTIETSPGGPTLRFVKSAIARKLSFEEDEGESEDEEADETS